MRTFARLVVAVLLTSGVVVLSPAVAGAAGGGGCHRIFDGRPVDDRAGDTVELAGACMEPTVLRVEPGTRVSFVNRDPREHNVIGAGVFIDALAIDATATATFDRAGVYPYSCTLHPGMVGAVVVEGATESATAARPSTATPRVPAAAGGAVAVAGLGAGVLLLQRRRRPAAA